MFLQSDHAVYQKTRPVLCDRCGEEVPPGEGYYGLAGGQFCRGCLPAVAAAWFLPYLRVAGEEARRL